MPKIEFFGTSESGAYFSPCQRYRYTLWRRWSGIFANGQERLIAFVGLNPSTADEFKNDNTITRLIGFSNRWDFDGMVMLNLFAWRDTKPSNMKKAAEPIGELNDRVITEVASVVDQVVVCWGNHGCHRGRSSQVLELLEGRELWHFGMTNSGEPKHPLMLPNDLQLERL